MENIINVKEITVKKNRVEYVLDCTGEVKKYFNPNQNLFIEYNENIDNVPLGILVIPLLTNILPIAWFSDAQILVDEIDKNFYESIDQIKQGYIEMHTNVLLRGSILPKNIVDYSYETTSKTATFFSGGVDSMATLLSRINEKPTLVTLWGSDIKLTDISGWNKVQSEVVNFAKCKGLDNLLVKSSFRTFISESRLDADFSNLMNDGWWHGAQHGIGLIGHIAPYAYLHKLKTLYVPATYTLNDGHVSCASYPTIDNKVKISSTSVFHEGFENNRQSKIGIICDYVKKYNEDLFIRVCWISEGGRNCSKCEKCSRTIMGIIAEFMNPNDFGFYVTTETLKDLKRNVTKNIVFSKENIRFWLEIQQRFQEHNNYWKNNKQLKWILKINFIKNNQKNIRKKRISTLIINIKSILRYKFSNLFLKN